ncbi:glycosyltransferase family 2 protein [Geomonas agri]|uniref:glycosyltransferase family 2 protein n=1 Tax=Geomonas agri TaxID=2873702 RepID=UPI001CD44BE7|nr:glycosyltransferase family 2 protein [Geomonas agri]
MSVLLSVLIPVYNWNVSRLVLQLIEEADAFGLWEKVEVILLDDGSPDREVAATNEEFCLKHPRLHLEYGSLGRNVGRSAIRNMLASKASGAFLLFLDCDILPDSDRFLGSYLGYAETDDFDAVCGGVSYRTRVLYDAGYDYHAYLGNKKEVKSASKRNREPWRHILTSNIMVRKSVFEATTFDERFTGYGYEDIEWGIRLSQQYRILHADNTVSHLGLASKATVYQKMRASVPNYLLLKELCPKAFHASAVSRLVRLLTAAPAPLLSAADHLLKNAFSSCGSNRLSFILFQINFAVLLAAALKAKGIEGPPRDAAAGGAS